MTYELLKNMILTFKSVERRFMDDCDTILIEGVNGEWAVIFFDCDGIQINYDETDRSGSYGLYIERDLDDFSTINILNTILDELTLKV